MRSSCHTFVLALGLAAAFSTVLLLGAPFVFRWMGGQGEMLSAALAYANVAFSGAVSICMLNLLGSAVRGTGNMGLPAGVIVGSVIAHVLISPLLIFGWGPLPALGPAGAGWGLMLSFGAGSLVLLAYLRSSRSLVTLAFRGVPLRWELFAEILKVGVPGLINVIITNLSVVLLTGIAGHLGREAAIGYAMGARLEYILHPAGIRFRHGDRRDGRHQLGRQAVSPRARDRVDRSRNRGRCLRNDRIDRRAVSRAVDGSVQRRPGDRPSRHVVPADRRADLRPLRPRDGALLRDPRVRQRPGP